MQEIYKVENMEGTRIDQYLSMIDSELTRTYVKKLIDNLNVTVNEKTVKPSYKINIGDIIKIDVPETKKDEILPEKMEIKIFYEDEDILVIDKNQGVVVHPGHGNISGTLVNGLMYSHNNKLSSINGITRPGIVHRIDKNTTGLLVIAKTDAAHIELANAFKNHEVERTYTAIVKGIIEKDRLKLNLPIGRDIIDRKKMSVKKENSREAITNIIVLERFVNSNMTFIQANLETGRTHQIRVHMSYIGHPIVGDKTYSKSKNEFGIEGQLLHSKKLGFVHPITGKTISCEVKEHKEFDNVLNKLRKRE